MLEFFKADGRGIVDLVVQFFYDNFYGGVIPIFFIVLFISMIGFFIYFKKMYLVLKSSNGDEINEKYLVKKQVVKSYSLDSIFSLIELYISKVIGCVVSVLKGRFELKIWNEFLTRLFFVSASPLNVESRAKYVVKEFPIEENEFFHHKERAFDMDAQFSAVQQGRMVNGKSVADYMEFYIPIERLKNIFTEALVVAAASFVLLSIIISPANTLGYVAPNIKQDNYYLNAKNEIIENPKISAFGDADVWTKQGEEELNAKVEEYALAMGMIKIDEANGWNYTSWGWIIKDGYAIALCLSLSFFFSYIVYRRVSLVRAYKNPYIDGNIEEFGALKNKFLLNTHKIKLAASNRKAMNFDRNSPLIFIGKTSGHIQEFGVVGALNIASVMYLSCVDIMQNVLIFGGTGGGKTFAIIRPLFQKILKISKMYEDSVEKQELIWDTKYSLLTEQAIKEGYLNEYKAIPWAKLNVGSVLMDIKAQLPVDFNSTIAGFNLKKKPLIIGGKVEDGEYSFDLTFKTPEKFIAFLESINSQLGGEGKGDMWNIQSMKKIKSYMDVAFLFSKTNAGLRFMMDNKFKCWSGKFFYELINIGGNNLLAHCIYHITEELSTTAGQLKIGAYINDTVINSMKELLVSWYELKKDAPETAMGIEVNMDADMSVFNNSAIAAFTSCYSEHSINLNEIAGRHTQFKMDTGNYAQGAKLVLLAGKTIIYENAKTRQSKYSDRTLSMAKYISDNLTGNVPSVIDITYAPVEKLSELGRELQNNFMKSMDDIKKEIGSIYDEEKTSYENLQYFVAEYKRLKDTSAILVTPFDSEVNQLVVNAINLHEAFMNSESFAKQCIVLGKGFDKSVFAVKPNETEEQKRLRESLLLAYYRYEEAKIILDRDMIFFIKDEDQQLITIDKKGVCESDASFLNINRSTRVGFINASQHLSAYQAVVNEKAIVDNYTANHRTTFNMAVDDNDTVTAISKLVSKTDKYENREAGENLMVDGVKTDQVIYAGLNTELEKNWDVPHNPYVFADVFDLENEDVLSNFKDFGKTALWQIVPNKVESLKKHFFKPENILGYENYGRDEKNLKNDSNLRDVVQSVSTQVKQAKDDYSKLKDESIRKDVEVITDALFMQQSNAYCLVKMQRAGRTVVEQFDINTNNHMDAQNELIG